MANRTSHAIPYGGWLLAAAATIGCILALYYFVDDGNGIAFTQGAALMFAASGLVLAAALALAFDHDKATWLTGFLYVALFFGLIGTGICAYFLNAYWVSGLMILGFIGWLISVFADPSDEQIAHHAIRKEVLS